VTTIETLKEKYGEVQTRIAAAAKRSGRDPSAVILVAVTKYAEPDQIRDLVKLGHVDFAENHVQQLLQRAAMIDEWLARHRAMPGVPFPPPRDAAEDDDPWSPGAARPRPSGPPAKVRWHMIGHLQRNKARKVIDIARLIHSVDSLRLAEELQAVAFRRDKPVEVLLQVNCSEERQKFGCAIAAAQHLAEAIETTIHVRLRGLMTMAAYSENPEEARSTFARGRELFEEIRVSGVVGPHFNILSMGMSGDFEVAIEEGANMVRVGSALFGERPEGAAGEHAGDEADGE
jgi:PLP dependent protein